MTNKEQIIKNFGINIEEVEPTVYKVLNTDKEFNIDKLQWALKDCVLITSEETHYEKDSDNISTRLGNIYYIVINFNQELGLKYDAIATKEFKATLYEPYQYNPNYKESIDTIYSKDEVYNG